jgi:hypothetical protein
MLESRGVRIPPPLEIGVEKPQIRADDVRGVVCEQMKLEIPNMRM